MSSESIIVYGTGGEIKYPSGSSEKNIDIQSAWTAKRRLLLKNKSDGVVLQCYLRAHTGTHEEQLYIQFSTDTSENLFEQFSEAVNNHLIEKLDWKIQDHQTNNLIREILAFDQSREVNSPLEKIGLLLEDNQDVKAYTNNYTRAIHLVHELAIRGCDVTIADKEDALKYCDVGIAVNSQYQSQMTLSQTNETYYRQKRDSLKREKLRESLLNSVHEFRSELSDEALIENLGRILSDTDYRITTESRKPTSKNKDQAESEYTNSIDSQATDSIETNNSLSVKSANQYSTYPLLSYGVNIIVGVIFSLFLLEGALNYWGISIAQTFGIPIEMMAILVGVFLVSYGSLGALWATSYLPSTKAEYIGFVCLALSVVTGGIVSGFGSSYIPSTIAGFPWWISLSLLPPIMGLAEAVRSNNEVWSGDLGDEDTFPFRLPPASGAALGMSAGFVTANIIIEFISTTIINGAVINKIGIVVAFLILLGGSIYSWMKGNYRTQIQTAGVTLGALIGGTTISTLVLRLNVLSVIEVPSYKILAGAILGVVTFLITGYIGHKTSLFEAPENLLILYPNKGDTITEPEIEVEILNELSVDWVTVKLNKNGEMVDSDIIRFEHDDFPNNLQTSLRATTNGDHIIRAHTGKGEYSGHHGGRDESEIHIEGIQDSSMTSSEKSESPESLETENDDLDPTGENIGDSNGDESNSSRFSSGRIGSNGNNDELSSQNQKDTTKSTVDESETSNSDNDSWEIK